MSKAVAECTDGGCSPITARGEQEKCLALGDKMRKHVIAQQTRESNGPGWKRTARNINQVCKTSPELLGN